MGRKHPNVKEFTLQVFISPHFALKKLQLNIVDKAKYEKNTWHCKKWTHTLKIKVLQSNTAPNPSKQNPVIHMF
jgi:hypothetical protein